MVDIDVLVAGMRSPLGASAALLVTLLEATATVLLSVAMALEYGSSCLRAVYLLAAKASETDARDMIDTIIDVDESVEVYCRWRPQLPDQDDVETHDLDETHDLVARIRHPGAPMIQWTARHQRRRPAIQPRQPGDGRTSEQAPQFEERALVHH